MFVGGFGGVCEGAFDCGVYLGGGKHLGVERSEVAGDQASVFDHRLAEIEAEPHAGPVAWVFAGDF